MNQILNVGIVGAGIQGISNALFLQKKGFKVTIFDKDEPGSSAASYGNAGHFSPYASLSLNVSVPELFSSSCCFNKFELNFLVKLPLVKC